MLDDINESQGILNVKVDSTSFLFNKTDLNKSSILSVFNPNL